LLLFLKRNGAPFPCHSTVKEIASGTGGLSYNRGAIIRGDSTQKNIALVFTGDEFGEGSGFIAETLDEEKVKASFFLTGRFYRNKDFKKPIKEIFSA